MSDSELEIEETQYEPEKQNEDIEEEKKETKQSIQKKKITYLNKDAKRNKQ